jgi:prophage regulatory protein
MSRTAARFTLADTARATREAEQGVHDGAKIAAPRVEPEHGAPAKSEPRRMLNEAQVRAIIPVSRTTLFRMAKTGRFPRSTYISPNRRVWFEDEIIAWQRSVDEFNPNRGRGGGRRA